MELQAGTVEVGAGTVEVGARPMELGAGTMELGAGTVEVGAGTVEVGARPMEFRAALRAHGQGPTTDGVISGVAEQGDEGRRLHGPSQSQLTVRGASL
jgi:hypothetical protein